MQITGECRLTRSAFPVSPEQLLKFGKISVHRFRYQSGVEALQFENPFGYLVLLPYQGQQIWDAVFQGRSLKMRNFFDAPVYTNDLLGSYGAFLYHCGARRTGTPGPKDDHPLHGELPGAFYDDAWLEFGTDKDGRLYVALTGMYRYVQAFGDKYTAKPTVRIYEDDFVLGVNIQIYNQASKPMDMMYLCHINFFPGENAEIIQATGWTPEDMVVRSSIPSHVKPTPEFLNTLEELKRNPEKTRFLKPEDSYDPEVVFFVKNLKTDTDGFTHMLQKHCDGTADYVSYRPSDLDHTIRWILIHEDQKVNGMALPATSGPEGYIREKEKGNVKVIQPGETKEFEVRVGAVDPERTDQIRQKIELL